MHSGSWEASSQSGPCRLRWDGFAPGSMGERPTTRRYHRALATRRLKSANSWDAYWRNSRRAARESPAISSATGSAQGKPTHEALGIKAIQDADPRDVIERVMDVDAYEGHIAHVEACRSLRDPARETPERVHFFQRVSVPGVARIQHELVLVDAGTIEGYRVAYWYLLKPETDSLNPEAGARSEFNVGAWLVAPGVVGYALSNWPRRGDVNALQWALADFRRRWFGEESRRGQHRWHGVVGEGAAWDRPGPLMISCSAIATGVGTTAGWFAESSERDISANSASVFQRLSVNMPSLPGALFEPIEDSHKDQLG